MATPPDARQSNVVVSANQCPVGTPININIMLKGQRGNPMTGPNITGSVDLHLEDPSGKNIRLGLPANLPPGGKCMANYTLGEVGVYKVHVKICGAEITNSPVKVKTIVRGERLSIYKPPMEQPHDILMLDNVFVVTDKGNNQVQVFDTQFRPANKFCSPEGSGMYKFDPYAIAWTGNTFVVTDIQNHRIVEFKNFVPFRVFGEETLIQPTGIAVGKDKKHVYVADGKKHCIFVFDERRECVSIIGGHGTNVGQMDTPWFMATNSNGNLVVAEFRNHRVQVWNPKQNKAVRVIAVKHNGKTWDCRGLALDCNDNIYITVRCGFMRGFSTETVLVYSPGGEFLGNFGEGFNYVRGMTVEKIGPDTIAYVVDGANNRIISYKM